ncbi:AraC family transcriptional regulator [Paenibacillus sp. PL2-23]|uniref:helix-turn-helix domain-containing protein n=1 Tax=Paenibacillus sp. PL2-23 TaxID=2100729 RepID=UPI0030F74EAE
MDTRVVINRNELPSLMSIGVFETSRPWIHLDRILAIDTMLYVTNGAVTVCEENTDYTISEGEVFFLKHQCRHWGRLPIAPGSRWFWISFLPFRSLGEEQQLILPKQYKLTQEEPFVSMVETMLQLYASSSPVRHERLNGMLYQILYELLHQHLHGGEEHSPSSLTAKIIKLLKQQAELPFDSHAIANAMNMNYTYLGRVFKLNTGTTINHYYRRLKIERAIAYMQSDMLNISQISERLSFPNPYYFSRVFKQVTGVSPKEYQQQLYR